MTVLRASKRAWAATFCSACRCIVHYQADDVVTRVKETPKGRGNNSHGIDTVENVIICKCNAPIVIS